MTESENTSAGASSSSGGESAPARKRASHPRRKAGTAARRKASPGTKKTATRRTTSTKRGSPKGPATRRRRRSPKATGLEAFLNDLAKKANQAGSKISDLSEEGSAAARRTFGKVSAGSKKTISRVKREWDGMNNTRKLEFFAGLLAALAAAGAVRKASRK
ncbi:MAG: hypothetical protein M3547_15700 [Acidobacteriota bacterium]|nr:hypothetical protein [Acidobacteriota bacterium]